MGIFKDVWRTPVKGTPMYRLTRRLSLLKPKLESLHHYHTSHVYNSVTEMKAQWDVTQVLLDESPYYEEYMDAERGFAK